MDSERSGSESSASTVIPRRIKLVSDSYNQAKNLKRPSGRDVKMIKEALIRHTDALMEEAYEIYVDSCIPLDLTEQKRLEDFEKRLDKLDFQVDINVTTNRLLRMRANVALAILAKLLEL